MDVSGNTSLGATQVSEARITEVLEGVGSERTLKKGEILFHQEEDARSLYVIRSGSMELYMKLEEGREESLGVAKTGEILGELEFIINEGKRAHSARATKDTIVVGVAAEDLHRIEETNPLSACEFLSWVATVLLQRLSIINELHLKEISRITDLIGAQKCDFSNILRDTFQIEVSLTGNEDGFVGRIISIAESRGGYWLTVLDGDAALVFIPFHSISTIRSY
jgi:CRP-like cAMP-binding protein